MFSVFTLDLKIASANLTFKNIFWEQTQVSYEHNRPQLKRFHCNIMLWLAPLVQLLFLNTYQKMINGVGWLDDRHGLSPILYDTAPLCLHWSTIVPLCFHLL